MDENPSVKKGRTWEFMFPVLQVEAETPSALPQSIEVDVSVSLPQLIEVDVSVSEARATAHRDTTSVTPAFCLIGPTLVSPTSCTISEAMQSAACLGGTAHHCHRAPARRSRPSWHVVSPQNDGPNGIHRLRDVAESLPPGVKLIGYKDMEQAVIRVMGRKRPKPDVGSDEA